MSVSGDHACAGNSLIILDGALVQALTVANFWSIAARRGRLAISNRSPVVSAVNALPRRARAVKLLTGDVSAGPA